MFGPSALPWPHTVGLSIASSQPSKAPPRPTWYNAGCSTGGWLSVRLVKQDFGDVADVVGGQVSETLGLRL